jgi:hypothetical protein
MEDYHVRSEMMQATIATLPTIQNEQHKICKLLGAFNSRFKDMEQTLASVPRIKAEQVRVQNEVTEWKARFSAAAQALTELFPSKALDQIAPLGLPEEGQAAIDLAKHTALAVDEVDRK